ncbi:hypothetical protein CEV34_4077 [Brucella pseudogrignonensis]|uniref:Uncharacterized protein n=1 Tax=Brucella pseudogrignonensis TaxID=419475 RepID=A0A256G714_9HYPH|nr:hypothetical protein CEV34_4077 [Brucella pseudogrignonensis]
MSLSRNRFPLSGDTLQIVHFEQLSAIRNSHRWLRLFR